MVRPDLYARPDFAIDRQRGEFDVSEAAHAQLGERQAGGKSARGVAAGVDDAGAVREDMDGEAQLGRAIDELVGQRAGSFVHSQVSHVGRTS